MLGLLAGRTERVALGSGLLQIPARQPTATAMAAATLDVISGGRFRLGLGVSGPQVSEGWYGVPFARPLVRTREYVEIVRAALAREGPLEYAGEHWTLPLPDGLGRPLKLLARAGPGAHPDLPRRRSARARSSRPAPSPTAGCRSCSTPSSPALIAARGGRRARVAHWRTSTSPRAAAGGRGRRRRGARRGPAVAGLLPGGDGRQGARTSTSRRPSATGHGDGRARGAGALPGRRPRRRRGGAERRDWSTRPRSRPRPTASTSARRAVYAARRDDPAGAAHGPGQGRRRARPGGGAEPGLAVEPDARPEGIPGSTLPGPFPVGAYARAPARRAARARARAALRRGVVDLRPAAAQGLLRAARRRRRGALRDVARRVRRARVDRAALADGVAGRGRRRPRLLPGRAHLLARLLLPRHRPAGGRRGRPARPARARCARRSAAEGLFEPQKALPRPLLPRTIGVVTGEGGKARDDVLAGPAPPRLGGPVVWAFAPVQDRHAAPRDRRARCRTSPPVARGRGRGRRPRRRLAGRPVRVLRRDPVPHRRAAARAGDRLGRPPHRPHADRRRRRGVLLDPDPRRRGGGAASTALEARARRCSQRGARGCRRTGRRAVLERARAPGRARRARPPSTSRATARRLHQQLREMRASARRGAGERARRSRAPRLLVLERKAAAAAGAGRRARRAPRPRAACALALAAHDPERTLERGYALVEDGAGEPVTSRAAAPRARRRWPALRRRPPCACARIDRSA